MRWLTDVEPGGVRRGEFDGQRHAIEAPADRANIGEFVRAWRKARIQGLDSGDKKFDRAVAQNVVRVIPARSGDVERRNAVNGLAVDVSRLVAMIVVCGQVSRVCVNVATASR